MIKDFWDIVICCRHIENYKNPTISQHIKIDLLESIGDHEAQTESFYNNVTNNDDLINKNDVTLPVNNDHSTINDNVSQN